MRSRLERPRCSSGWGSKGDAGYRNGVPAFTPYTVALFKPLNTRMVHLNSSLTICCELWPCSKLKFTNQLHMTKILQQLVGRTPAPIARSAKNVFTKSHTGWLIESNMCIGDMFSKSSNLQHLEPQQRTRHYLPPDSQWPTNKSDIQNHHIQR
jgi:hypothetical protein